MTQEMTQETKGRFGFHLINDAHRHRPPDLHIQFYVKSSALSRAADLAISPHLATERDIDQFVEIFGARVCDSSTSSNSSGGKSSMRLKRVVIAAEFTKPVMGGRVRAS